jgi:hypothetical protein
MNNIIFLSMVQQHLVGQGLLNIQASRSQLDTPQLLGLLWTSDQPDAETSTWQHTTLKETDIHVPGGIRTQNLSKWAVLEREATGFGRVEIVTYKIPCGYQQGY